MGSDHISELQKRCFEAMVVASPCQACGQTGSPALANLLAQKIPAEQLPIVIGKLQIAYELFSLLSPDSANPLSFDLRSLWTLLLDNTSAPDRNAWAFGRALVEYWTQNLTVEQLRERFEFYLQS